MEVVCDRWWYNQGHVILTYSTAVAKIQDMRLHAAHREDASNYIVFIAVVRTSLRCKLAQFVFKTIP